jgi:hypothetical protein
MIIGLPPKFHATRDILLDVLQLQDGLDVMALCGAPARAAQAKINRPGAGSAIGLHIGPDIRRDRTAWRPRSNHTLCTAGPETLPRTLSMTRIARSERYAARDSNSEPAD